MKIKMIAIMLAAVMVISVPLALVGTEDNDALTTHHDTYYPQTINLEKGDVSYRFVWPGAGQGDDLNKLSFKSSNLPSWITWSIENRDTLSITINPLEVVNKLYILTLKTVMLGVEFTFSFHFRVNIVDVPITPELPEVPVLPEVPEPEVVGNHARFFFTAPEVIFIDIDSTEPYSWDWMYPADADMNFDKFAITYSNFDRWVSYTKSTDRITFTFESPNLEYDRSFNMTLYWDTFGGAMSVTYEYFFRIVVMDPNETGWYDDRDVVDWKKVASDKDPHVEIPDKSVYDMMAELFSNMGFLVLLGAGIFGIALLVRSKNKGGKK